MKIGGEMHERSRLEELMQKTKIKTTRQELINKFNEIGMQITISSFLDVEYSKVLAGNAYRKLDELENLEKIKNFKEVVHKLLEIRALHHNRDDHMVILYPYESLVTGAISIKFSEFWKHLKGILKTIYFDTGNNHLIVIDQEMQFGICSITYEDYFTLTSWEFYN